MTCEQRKNKTNYDNLLSENFAYFVIVEKKGTRYQAYQAHKI